MNKQNCSTIVDIIFLALLSKYKSELFNNIPLTDTHRKKIFNRLDQLQMSISLILLESPIKEIHERETIDDLLKYVAKNIVE